MASRLGAGFLLTSSASPEDTSKYTDPVTFGEGMTHLLSLTQCHRPAGVKNLIELWHEVRSMQALSEVQQVLYMKDFLYKFRSEPNWLHVVHTRPNLIFEAQAASAKPRFESNHRVAMGGFQPASSLLPRVDRSLILI